MMQKILKVFSFILFVVIVLILAYLGGIYFGFIEYGEKEVVNLITLNQTDISLKKGKSYQLVADVYPAGIAHDEIIYESSNPDVAMVNSLSGYIIAKSDGNAVITAKINDEVKTICNVNVGNVDSVIKKIEITNEKINILIGKSYQLKYKISPSTATMHNLYYESSDESVAKVDKNGKITALNVGKTIISVFSNNSSATDSVIVEVYKKNTSNNNSNVSNPVDNIPKEVEVKSVDIKNENINLRVSGTINLKTEILPKNSNQSLNYNSSNVEIAKVDANGKVTAVSKGEAYIIATAINGKTDKVKVIVQEQDISVKSVKIVNENDNLKVGENIKIPYEISPSNATNQGVKWESSDESVVTVDSYGNISALKSGTATIKIRTNDGNYTDKINIVIKNVNNIIKETSIKLKDQSIDLYIGKSKNLGYEILPNTVTYKDVKWESSNSNVASINNGMVVAKAVGKAIITITSHYGLKDTVTINVKPIKVTGVSLTPKSISIKVGETSSITPTILPKDATNKKIIWTSSNSNIARVDEYGIVTGVGIGTATITSTTSDGGYSNTCKITVNSNIVNVSSVTLNKTSQNLNVGGSVTLTATVSPSNATNKGVTWTSSNPKVVTVSNGVVKAIGVGEAYVYATSQSNSNIKSSCLVKVSANTVNVSSVTLNKTSQNWLCQ